MSIQNKQLKALVIVPSWHYYADPVKHQPFWELYYATHLREAGYEVEVVDLRIAESDSFEDMTKSIVEADFTFIGFLKLVML